MVEKNETNFSAEPLTIGKYLEDRKPLEVPRYQRSYAWERDELVDFIADLKKLLSPGGSEEVHFFGGVVTAHEVRVGQKQQLAYWLVDGQQRLTSLSILIASILGGYQRIREQAQEEGDTELADELSALHGVERRKFVFYEDVVSGKAVEVPRLTLSKRDESFFRQLIKAAVRSSEIDGEMPKATKNSPASHSRLSACHSLLADELIEKPIFEPPTPLPEKAEALKALLAAVTRRCEIVHVTTGRLHEAYALFSVLNDRGKALAESDLLRAEILEMLEDHPKDQDLAEAIWDTLQAGPVGSADAFLRDFYASVQGERAPSKDLARLFRKTFFNWPVPLSQKDAGRVIQTLKQMEKELGTYSSIREGEWPYETAAHLKSTGWQRSRLRSLVSVLGRTSTIPLLMSIYVARDEDFFVKSVLLLERLDFRYLIVGRHPGTLAEFYWKVAARVRKQPTCELTFDDLRREIEPFVGAAAEDQAFRANLPSQVRYGTSSATNKRLLHLLSTLNDALPWLQSEKVGDPEVDVTSVRDFAVIDIEHIQAQNPKKECRDPDLAKVKNELGNLTLWGSKPNRGARDACVEEKWTKYLASDVEITRLVGRAGQETGSWNLEAFEKRHGQLIDWACKYYSISEEATKLAEELRKSEKSPRAWVVVQKEDSPYADVIGEAYEYTVSSKHGRLVKGAKYRIEPGDYLICFRPSKDKDPGVFGVGRVEAVIPADDFEKARYDWYTTISPSLPLESVNGKDPRSNPQNPIHEVPIEYLEAVLKKAAVETPSDLLSGT
jgi:hypothetical protein